MLATLDSSPPPNPLPPPLRGLAGHALGSNVLMRLKHVLAFAAKEESPVACIIRHSESCSSVSVQLAHDHKPHVGHTLGTR
jgi:hypothetical protein